MSHHQAQQPYRATPQVQAPHPSSNIVPHQLTRVAEHSDLRGENLTEEQYRDFLTEYIIYRFEKVESPDQADSNGDHARGSWANCTRRRLPTVDKQEAKNAIDNLNREDRRKGRTLLDKQRSLAPIQQDQLTKLEGDLSNEVQLDSRFQIVLAQADYTLKPIFETHESFSRRRNVTKRKVRDKKNRYERTSITAYFKRVPRPEQVPSLLYRQLELEKHQGQQLQERQASQQQIVEQIREYQERARVEEARRVAQQQAQHQQQQAQLLRQQIQLQSQQAQLQKQQALQQQRQQQNQEQQQAQRHSRSPGGTQQQVYPIRPNQGKTGQAQTTGDRAHQVGHLAGQRHASPIRANTSKQMPRVVHDESRYGQDNTIRVMHENVHHDKSHGHQHNPSIISSGSSSLYSENDSSSGWDSEPDSEKDSDSTPTSVPSRSSGSYRISRHAHGSRHHAYKHPSQHERRSEYRRHQTKSKYHEARDVEEPHNSDINHPRGRRHSLHKDREPPTYILTASDRRVPVRAPEVPRRDISPIVPVKDIEAIRAQAYHDGRSDQRYEDQTRLAAAVVAESLDARRYSVSASASSPSPALRYEPRTAPRPVIVTERESPSIRHVPHSEVERQLDRQYLNDALGRLRLVDRMGDRDVCSIENDYNIVLPDRDPLRHQASFFRVDRDAKSSPHWASHGINEDWDKLGEVRALGRERRRDSSPPPLVTAASSRNPFTPESMYRGRLDHVYSSERGSRRLF